MSVIRIYQGKSKPAKKKPGWQKTEAEYKLWLAGISNLQLNPQSKGRALRTGKSPAVIIDPVVRAPVVSPERLQRGHSLMTPGGAGTKQVARPDILYKHDPEMLKRELAARERKFNVAPAYNKGPDILVTEEQLVQQLSSNKRRS